MSFGKTILELRKGKGITQEELAAAKADPSVTHLFAGFEKPLCDDERGETDGIIIVDCLYTTTQQVLDGFEFYFENMAAINSLAQKRPAKE